ncbi:MAG TPA: carboxypeptidase regulatory-like domain-containing protein [Solirubrobacteraceae bacterium]|nr:carboxypeptidase regulatory-like domain-containing protein [Solirubrobacteraceae bacterium]
MSGLGVIRAITTAATVLTALAAGAGPAWADATTGTVTGQVVDANGAPIAGVCVDADTVPYPGGAGYGGPPTDAEGDYAFSLPPGKYVISFQGCGKDYVTQFYPGQPSPRTAAQVTVLAGQTTAAINAQMVVGGTIVGKMLDAATAVAPPQLEIQPEAEPLGPPSFPGNPEPVAYGIVSAGGGYTLTGLAPGSYVVHFSAGSVNGVPSPYADDWYPDAPDPGHATVVNVQSGQTVSLGVELAEAPGTVTGRVADTVDRPLAGYLVRASITEPGGSLFPDFDFTTSGPDGTFTLTGLAPGAWTIAVERNGDRSFIQSQSATVASGETTPNVDFGFCVGIECPPTRLFALRARIEDHQLLFACQISDPSGALLTIVLRGRVGGRAVKLRGIPIVAQSGAFDSFLALPRRDRSLRSGTLTLAFAPSQAARGGRFVVRVPSVYPGPLPGPAHHRHRHKRRTRHRSRRVAPMPLLPLIRP